MPTKGPESPRLSPLCSLSASRTRRASSSLVEISFGITPRMVYYNIVICCNMIYCTTISYCLQELKLFASSRVQQRADVSLALQSLLHWNAKRDTARVNILSSLKSPPRWKCTHHVSCLGQTHTSTCCLLMITAGTAHIGTAFQLNVYYS